MEPDRSPDSGPGTAPTSLDVDSILTAEFEYIAQTAFQANEDRARVTNLYLITLGGFIAAILGVDATGWIGSGIYWALFILFALLAANSVLTLLQLVRLRQAWRDSVQAMNQIKDVYKAQYPVLEAAFRWETKTVPPLDKPWSISFLLALEVSLLGGIVLGAAVYFVGLCCRGWPLWIAALAGTLFAVGQVLLYRGLLGWRQGRARRERPAPVAGDA